jgi:hypothetical protein
MIRVCVGKVTQGIRPSLKVIIKYLRKERLLAGACLQVSRGEIYIVDQDNLLHVKIHFLVNVPSKKMFYLDTTNGAECEP